MKKIVAYKNNRENTIWITVAARIKKSHLKVTNQKSLNNWQSIFCVCLFKVHVHNSYAIILHPVASCSVPFSGRDE